MARIISLSILILVLGSVCVAQDPGWPRQKFSSAGRLIYYQPQIDEWNNYKDLAFRMAFSLTPTGDKQVVGVNELFVSPLPTLRTDK